MNLFILIALVACGASSKKEGVARRIDIIHGTGLETYHVSVSCAISHARPILVTVFAPPSSCISIETLFFNLHYFVGLYRRTW